MEQREFTMEEIQAIVTSLTQPVDKFVDTYSSVFSKYGYEEEDLRGEEASRIQQLLIAGTLQMISGKNDLDVSRLI